MKHNIGSQELIKDYNRFTRGELMTRDVHRLIVCAMPKSASSFLHQICCQMPGFNNCNLIPDSGGREQELCIRKLIMGHRGFDDYASHMHLRYSNVTRDLIKQFGLKPIVMTRDIFDLAVSSTEFIQNLGQVAKGENFPLEVNSFMASIPPEILHWPEYRQYDFVADMVLPWNFNFLNCWQKCETAFWIKYEDLISDTVDVVSELSNYYQLGWSREGIEQSVAASLKDPALIKLNKGVVGRGKEMPENARQKILKMASYYSDYDLSPIGL